MNADDLKMEVENLNVLDLTRLIIETKHSSEDEETNTKKRTFDEIDDPTIDVPKSMNFKEDDENKSNENKVNTEIFNEDDQNNKIFSETTNLLRNQEDINANAEIEVSNDNQETTQIQEKFVEENLPNLIEDNEEKQKNPDVTQTLEQKNLQDKVDGVFNDVQNDKNAEMKKCEYSSFFSNIFRGGEISSQEILLSNPKINVNVSDEDKEEKTTDEEKKGTPTDGNNENSGHLSDNTQETDEGNNVPEDDESYEKSVINDQFKKKALLNSLASNWGHDLHNPYALVNVPKDSWEFKKVNDLFSHTSRGTIIKKLERVENPYLLAQYLLKKDEKLKNYCCVEEKILLHGTQKTNIEGICKYNFDWRRFGSSRGHKFGRGVSFAPEVSYAMHYTNGDRTMFMCKVLVCKSTVGDYQTVVPPEPYDTTRNSQETVFVKFEDDEFYPQYLIHY